MSLAVDVGERREHYDLRQAVDLSIPLNFGGPQPNHFGARPARSEPLRVTGFVGDTRLGGSCNAETLELLAHCNGTHTECVGHVTDQRVSIRDRAPSALLRARLVSVTPVRARDCSDDSDPTPRPGDLLITAESLGDAVGQPGDMPEALIVRTWPNSWDKRTRRYDQADQTPYLSRQAMTRLVAWGVDHLLLDLPSADRLHDEGKLTSHRIFWGLPPASRDADAAQRGHATITEMIYVPDSLPDGPYLLNLQIGPFMSDAAPSRPLLYSPLDAS